ncbi:MAG: VOC family protein [Armatimonadota bacterium]|nr:VOC family protein [Armatimonadota bacterium]
MDIAVPDHVNIVVTDMNRSVEFYQNVFQLRKGFETVLTGAWIDQVTGEKDVEAHCVFMESSLSPIRIELLRYVNPTAPAYTNNSRPQVPGLRHIAFNVPDLDDFYDRARSLGVTFTSPPVAVPFPLPGGRSKRLCYFLDPDGALLEAAEYRSDKD